MKNGVKNVQTVGYNGACTVLEMKASTAKLLLSNNILIFTDQNKEKKMSVKFKKRNSWMKAVFS